MTAPGFSSTQYWFSRNCDSYKIRSSCEGCLTLKTMLLPHVRGGQRDTAVSPLRSSSYPPPPRGGYPHTPSAWWELWPVTPKVEIFRHGITSVPPEHTWLCPVWFVMDTLWCLHLGLASMMEWMKLGHYGQIRLGLQCSRAGQHMALFRLVSGCLEGFCGPRNKRAGQFGQSPGCWMHLQRGLRSFLQS